MAKPEENDIGLKMAEYRKAIEQEFELVEAAIETGEAEKIGEAARTLLMSKASDAATTIAYLAKNAFSEATRLAAAKYILDNCLGEKGSLRPVDPLESLVNELRGNDPKKEKAQVKPNSATSER